MKLSLVVPCYNEQDNVFDFYDCVEKCFSTKDFDYEIVFVNDGSRDDTFVKLKEIVKTKKSFKQIAQEFNLCRRTITRINNGYTHQMEDVEYPIRKTKFETKEWVCIDCGKPVSKGAMRCDSCQRIASRAYKRPSREELKNLIRSLPMTKVGEKFNVADNTIRKWCDSYNLPRKKTEINKYSDIEWEKI